MKKLLKFYKRQKERTRLIADDASALVFGTNKILKLKLRARRKRMG